MIEPKPGIYRTIIAHERIRKKIEGHIHGPVSTKLLLIRYAITRLKESLRAKSLAAEIKELQEIESSVLEVLETHLRDICHQLYPSIIALGLSAGLRYLKSHYELNIPLSLHIDEKYLRLEEDNSGLLSQDDRLFIYRIADEALSNSVLHSGAKSINVDLQLKIRRLHLYLRDDGAGFRVEEKKDGPGLLAMKNYARAFRAVIDIQSSPGGGTATHLSFSLSEYLR